MTAVARLPEGSYDAVWASPGRVNLIGEHTDYNDGFVLPFALPHSTVVAATRRDRPEWTVWSETTGETVRFGAGERVEGWAAYVAGIVWVLREAGHDVPGADLKVTSDVPLGAGLSSSAAIECAAMAALVDLAGADLPMQLRPRLAQRAENEYVGAPTGIMDQAASTLCRAGHALFLDCRSLATEHVPFDLAADGLAMLVVDSKAPHAHVSGEYAARRRSCEEAAKILGVAALRDVDVDGLPDALAKLDDEVMRKRVRHVVTEDQRVLDTVAALRAGDVRAVGPLMTASHESMRDDYEITVPQVDTAVRVALEHGAYGARMTGGGFGGCVLALVDEEHCDGVAAAVRAAFAANGFPPPDTFVVAPGEGTRDVSG
ncbi:galactokinase [Dactylosporangium fulvum]|uniref:Galactokinase n=1 Tax=Dactylosporangium fulvum TaxID=53359 RepID=A0ABY5VWW9_9ACTN|nr:galactokinase [Dactylosporangium fulvum]UWP81299.1 galactokinase [Dactylosporangium fulvum]